MRRQIFLSVKRLISECALSCILPAFDNIPRRCVQIQCQLIFILRLNCRLSNLYCCLLCLDNAQFIITNRRLQRICYSFIWQCIAPKPNYLNICRVKLTLLLSNKCTEGNRHLYRRSCRCIFCVLLIFL